MIKSQVDDVLLSFGIAPPVYGSRRTRCPECSDFRKKRNEKPLVISIDDRFEMVSWHCHHCGISNSGIHKGKTQ